MKKFLFITVLFTTFLFSCMSTMSGMLNDKLISTNNEEYVNKNLKNVESLKLTEEQKKQTIAIYKNEIEILKKNAENEKAGKLKNSVSGMMYVYERWKSQISFEKLLNKEQLIQFRSSILNGTINGNDEKQMANLKKEFDKQGYKTDF
jgi:hypothetical protein